MNHTFFKPGLPELKGLSAPVLRLTNSEVIGAEEGYAVIRGTNGKTTFYNTATDLGDSFDKSVKDPEECIVNDVYKQTDTKYKPPIRRRR